MEIKLEDVKNLKIVPEKFESSTVFDIVEIKDDQVKIKMSGRPMDFLTFLFLRKKS